MTLGAIFLATVVSLSGSWEFRRDAGEWEQVTVPHDWAIAGPFDPNGDPDTAKLPWRGKAEYRRKFNISALHLNPTLTPTSRLYLCFDGVMARPEVFVNGRKAGGWDYGYAPFEVDITDFVHDGENELCVTCDTTRQRSRWYPGAGIYRNVRLEIVGPTDVIPNTMRIVATVDGKVSVSYRTPKGPVNDTFTVEKPVLWSPGNPKLYEYEVNGRKFRYGFRSIEFTANDGFHLNGKRFQIRGVNLHSDLGPLGMAFDREAMARQLRIMMEMGANAIRTAHNPPAQEVLDLCDELGLVVWEELFDKWEDTAGRLESEDLIEYIGRNTQSAVRRDRNHPCVIVWSLGDEIPYGPDEDPAGMTRERLAKLRELLREEDTTRPVGTGNNRKSMRADVFRDLDLTGWNYRHSYAPIREALPEKPIVYSESASCVSENGWYDMLAPTGKLDTAYDRFHIDGHECNAPTWADVPEAEFYRMERDRFVAGEFVWTGIDYLGEPSPFSSWYLTTRAKRPPITNAQSSRSSYFGICDLCGFPKDRYWIYRSYWRKDSHTLKLLPHWNWEGHEGEDVDVTVITDCEGAELLLNGKSFGVQQREPVPADYPLNHITNSPSYYDVTRLCRYRWRIPYAPGRLSARGYVNGRAKIAIDTETAGKPAKLLMIPEKCGGTLEYVQVYAADEKGVAHPLADNRVTFKVEGPGEIAAVCNGDARDLDSFKSDNIRLFAGKAQVIVRRTGEGVMTLTASSPGLASTSWTFGARLPERTEKSFTLASYNIRAAMACDFPPNFWTERAPRVVKVIQNRGFDIIGLQEPERQWIVRLLELLPGWKGVYAGREADGEGESASFIYDATRFDLVDHGTFWLSETPEVPGSKSWDTLCPRTCTWGRFQDRKTSKSFYLFNTHLDCGPNSAQTGGMKLILERIREVRAKTGLPVFLAGDMNTALKHRRQAPGPDHPLVMAAEVLKESWDRSETPHTGPWISWMNFPWPIKPYESLEGQIDHIFVSDDVRVLTSATWADFPDGLHASDHLSISCEVEL